MRLAMVIDAPQVVAVLHGREGAVEWKNLQAANGVLHTIELTDGGILLYDEAFLTPDLAGRYFAELRDTAPWEQKKAAFGHMQPRLTAAVRPR